MPDTGLFYYKLYMMGDNKALDKLVAAYSDSIVRYAYCYVNDAYGAEDIMEETFATLLVKHRHFQNNAHFHAYLYKTARNKSIDYLRRRSHEVYIEDVGEVLAPNNVEQDLIAKENYRSLYLCMQKLPAQYREVLYLNYFNSFTVEEMAHILKKNKKQIYNLLSRAKAALKDIFEKEGITYEDLF